MDPIYIGAVVGGIKKVIKKKSCPFRAQPCKRSKRGSDFKDCRGRVGLERPENRDIIRRLLGPSLPLPLPPGQADAGAPIATSPTWLGILHFFKQVLPWVLPCHWRCPRQNQTNNQAHPARLLDGSSSNLCSGI